MNEKTPVIYERGVARFGDLGLTPDRLEVYLARLPNTAAAHLLNAEDLYLTAACEEGGEKAWVALHHEYRRDVEVWCRRYGRPGQARDLAGSVWALLVSAGSGGRPRIASYQGLSPLRHWLRTVVRRRALNEVSVARTEPLGTQRDIPDPRGRARVEERLLRWRFAESMVASLRAAIGILDPAEIQLLALRFRDDVPLGELAKRLDIHQANVTRRIERICRGVRLEAGRHLERCYGLDRRLLDEYLSAATEGGWPEVAALCDEALTAAGYG